uniref:Uncharacterized protein n=1 Tax=Arundo donax TaxID=35708 RepID=A0A0A8ZJB2_ARUDO
MSHASHFQTCFHIFHIKYLSTSSKIPAIIMWGSISLLVDDILVPS